ncbi:MAG: acyl-CoA thioesterase [Candidatus Dadabacteria bacterium]|nr:MAG: acyl-CoA thioesterase [Candidatus Dadabacteria bacterium]
MTDNASKTSFVVAGKDVDNSYRHMHHAEILKPLEKARKELFESRGISLQKLMEEGTFPVVSKIEIEYLREIREGRYNIVSEVVEISRKELCIEQKIYNDKNKIATKAKVFLRFLRAGYPLSAPVPEAVSNSFGVADTKRGG